MHPIDELSVLDKLLPKRIGHFFTSKLRTNTIAGTLQDAIAVFQLFPLLARTANVITTADCDGCYYTIYYYPKTKYNTERRNSSLYIHCACACLCVYLLNK